MNDTFLLRSAVRHNHVARSRLAYLPYAGALLLAVLPGAVSARAATVDPLPAVARALSGVRSYQVTITSSISGLPRSSKRPPSHRAGGQGRFRRGAGLGFGRGGTETIVAVRKGSSFEDHIVFKGAGSSGQPSTREIVIVGTRMCTRNNGKGAYSCQTMTRSFAFDPTTAFEQGAGSAVFTPARAATIGGQVCAGYTYKNTLTNGTASGTVYISRATNLPCEQIATTTRRAFSGSGTFMQRMTILWSRYNDKRLTVPALPAR